MILTCNTQQFAVLAYLNFTITSKPSDSDRPAQDINLLSSPAIRVLNQGMTLPTK
jgi:hypothetical protein